MSMQQNFTSAQATTTASLADLGTTGSLWRRPYNADSDTQQGPHVRIATGIPCDISATGKLLGQNSPFATTYAQSNDVGAVLPRLIELPYGTDAMAGDVFVDNNSVQYYVNDVITDDLAVYLNAQLSEANQVLGTP